MALRDTQITNVGQEQGGDRLFVKEAGYINFNDQDFTGKKLRLMMLSPVTVTQHASTEFSIVSPTSALTPAYGYHMWSAATGMSQGSQVMVAAVEGATLVIDCAQLVTDANVVLSFLSAGTNNTVVNQGSVALSFINLSAGAFIKFHAIADGTWAVIEQNASATLNLAA